MPRRSAAKAGSRSNALAAPKRSEGAFTLIELMVVMGIMAIVMTMSVPLVYRATHKLPMSHALTDIVEVLSNARARAILQGHMTEVIFRPLDKRLEISGGGSSAPRPERPGGTSPAAPGTGFTDEILAKPSSTPSPAPGSGLSAQVPERVEIDGLFVNLTEYTRSEEARVRFYPNGTCDEMLLILRAHDKGEQRGITLEITTGLASILSENDLQNLRNGRL